ncbi:glypican-4 [Chrysoperla carnea]|uniref:glypican-4 n=1 Tax=Chrysoperla carnea TaxID=189513 RepID=UPI001D0706E8|nr:glypican-4 [Chrysoperla carnea]
MCIVSVFLTVVESAAGVDSNSCASVKVRFAKRGFAVSEFPVDLIEGAHLRICKPDTRGRTCCTEALESKLTSHTRHMLDTSLRDTLSRLATLLETRAFRFDEFFRKLLSKSKQDFHDMFKRTYGTIYLQNSYVFTDLFEELENYYAKGQVDLTETMDNFFIILYQRIFTVLNSAYLFDDKYLECVSNHMKELKPFGDVPHKLSAQVKRSFVATRTYGRALAVGVEVVKEMLSIKLNTECTHAVMRMQQCDACAGHSNVKACSNFCVNVMKGCYAYYADLETDWNSYVEAMDKVAERLIGPFNIEMVVEPINIKISDAIMNFQDRGPNISQRVFQGCGTPDHERRKRDVYTFPSRIKREEPKKPTPNTNQDLFVENTELPLDGDSTSDRSRRGSGVELSLEHYNFNHEKIEEDGTIDFEEEEEPGVPDPDVILLESLVKDIRQKIQETKYFWKHLPYQYCNNDDISESPAKQNACWNGTDVAKYLPEVQGDGLAAQVLNPSIQIDTSKPNSVLNGQMFKLKMIVNKLKMAFNGMDVEWMDHEEATIMGSGSGSGDDTDDTEPDGSGDSPDMDRGYPYPPSVQGPDHDRSNVFKSNKGHNTTKTYDSEENTVGAAYRPEMSLTRALVTYLCPVFVVWVGSIFNDVL